MFKMPLDISAHSLAHAIMFVYSHVFPLNTKAFLCAVLFLHIKCETHFTKKSQWNIRVLW